MNIFDIPVAAVSSLGKGLSIIYPNNHTQEEADFDSIASVGHEAHQNNFHSLQQMDAKTLNRCTRRIEKGELLKIKFA